MPGLLFIMVMIGLVFLPSPARAQPDGVWDQGGEDFGSFIIKALDEPEVARQEAFQILKEKHPTDPAWLQAYLYSLIHQGESLSPELKADERLQEAIAAAQAAQRELLVLLFQYQLERRRLQTGNAEPEAWNDFYQRYREQAEKQGAIRSATLVSMDQAAAAYNAGDMKMALAITHQAIEKLQKKVSQQDFQMIALRLSTAIFLEYSSARDKAIDIYQGLRDDAERLNKRWFKADVHFNYGLALMNAKRFDEAQAEFRAVAETALALRSKLLQGRALKGLAYAQQKMGAMPAAIQSYTEAIELMQAGHEDPVAVADTYKLLGVCYNSVRQYAKALKVLEIAERNSTAMQDKVWERDLQETRVHAYTALGNTVEALRAASRVNVLLRAISDDERKNELNKLKISLGLEIEEQKTKLLTEKNRAQEAELHHAELLRKFIFGLLSLAAVAIILLGVALKQTIKAKRSQERAHRILEHIEEGILSIGAGMRVEADLSPYLTRLLGLADRSPESFDSFAELLEKADLKEDERALMRATLKAMLGENALNWDLNHSQLPLELTLQKGSKVLSLDWQPIYNEAGFLQNVLLTVRDITARRELQKEVSMVRAHASRLEQRLVAILQIDARTAGSFVQEAQSRLPELRSNLEQQTGLVECYRQLHTLKGMARSLGFKEISTLVHELEDLLDLKQSAVIKPEMALSLLHEIELAVREYQVIIEKIHFQPNDSVPTEHLTFLHMVAGSLVPVRRMLDQAGFELARVDIQDHVPRWEPALLQAVQVLLLHGLTNCADHGFILPARKGLKVETRVALTVKVMQTADEIQIELSDNGVGLDLVKLGNIARDLQFVPQGDETIADVVFVDGISTAEQISTSSGRGMGLAALRQSITSLNGSVHLKPNPSGSGSRLVARIPRTTIKAA